MSLWEKIAHRIEDECGMQVEYGEDRFFVCPECLEPLYAEDWPEHDWDTCPICGFEFFSD